MASAATSVLRLITYATDRSSEPPMMTKVWPTATRPRPAAMCNRLTVVDWLNSRPPSIATTSQPAARVTTRATNTPGAVRLAGRVSAVLIRPAPARCRRQG
jgi:hypothetical protein